jgi:hypothetical protein
MAAPTSITVTYVSTPPSTTSTVTLAIPSNSDYTTSFLNAGRAGGISFVDGAGVPTFVPVAMSVKITAQ